MNKSRKFYSWRTQVYEQLTDEPRRSLDANIRESMSRGMAELIADLLTKHFAKEEKNEKMESHPQR